MKKIVSVIVAVVLSGLFVSTVSFASISDREIKNLIVKESIKTLKGAGVEKIIKNSASVQIIAHTQDTERGIHWVAANVIVQSDTSYGTCVVAVYKVLVREEGEVRTAKGEKLPASVTRDKGMKEYRAAFVNYKMSVEDDDGLFVITQDDRNKANDQIDNLLVQYEANNLLAQQ